MKTNYIQDQELLTREQLKKEIIKKYKEFHKRKYPNWKNKDFLNKQIGYIQKESNRNMLIYWLLSSIRRLEVLR
jgi:hypothetical protein